MDYRDLKQPELAKGFGSTSHTPPAVTNETVAGLMKANLNWCKEVSSLISGLEAIVSQPRVTEADTKDTPAHDTMLGNTQQVRDNLVSIHNRLHRISLILGA